MSEFISCFHIFFQILIISYIAVVNCNPQFLYHIINQQPYPYQHFGPPLIWFQGPLTIHSPYPFTKIQGQIAPTDQKKSPYSVDRTLYPKNETVDRTLYPKNEISQENSNENSEDSKKVICAYYDILGEPCPVKDLSSPKPRGMKLSYRTKVVSNLNVKLDILPIFCQNYQTIYQSKTTKL